MILNEDLVIDCESLSYFIKEGTPVKLIREEGEFAVVTGDALACPCNGNKSPRSMKDWTFKVPLDKLRV